MASHVDTSLPEDVVHLLRAQLSTLYPSCAAAQVCMARADPAYAMTDRYHFMELLGENCYLSLSV